MEWLFETSPWLWSLLPIALYLVNAVRVVPEYERLVIFTLGKFTRVDSGLTFVFGPFQTAQRVSLRTMTMAVPAQEIVSRDSVTLKVAAACFWRVIDPVKSVMKIDDYDRAILQVAQTGLRASLCKHNLDEILGKQAELAESLKVAIDRHTEEWGVEVQAVEMRDIEMPDNLKRALAREAEAERERRAKVIAANGELEAATVLASAAEKLQAQPAAIQLRFMETLTAIAAENNSTIIPFPTDLLHFAQSKDNKIGAKT